MSARSTTDTVTAPTVSGGPAGKRLVGGAGGCGFAAGNAVL